MAKTGGERVGSIPNPIDDPNIGDLNMNLTLRVDGATGTEYEGDFLEIGLTFAKKAGINRASLNTSRVDEFPENFVQTLQDKLPEILLGIAFGGLDDQQMPVELQNFNHTSG